MGTIKKGVLGGFSGTVGTVVGGSWKGREYMRSQPGPRKGQSSVKQLAQQAKFLTVVRFVNSFNGLMKFSFKSQLSKLTSRNTAHQYTFANALAGEYPDFTIDCTKVLVSNGSQLNVRSPKVQAEPNAQISFTWSDNSGRENSLSDDQALLVAYCPDLKLGTYGASAAPRTAGAATLDAREFAGHTVHTWIAMVKADGKQISESTYTGEISVTDEIIAPIGGSAKH